MTFEKQINELREHLEKAQNPVFYYDNDADGLCSFLMLRKEIGRGIGVPIRSYPELNEDYASKAEIIKADYVFILDKPLVSEKFIKRIEELGIPIIWIDHHKDSNFLSLKLSNALVYNSAFSNSATPVSNMIYQLLYKKEYDWIALAGCISDCYVPDFSNQVFGKYKELFKKNNKNAFNILYETEFGKIVRALNYGVKDSASNVIKMQKFLINCKSPLDVLSEVEENSRLREKYNELSKKQEEFVRSAEKNIKGNLLFFEYSGNTSMSADIANELAYRNPNIFICVGFTKGVLTNISLRGRGIKKIFSKVLKNLDGASGGGHDDAVGGRIMSKDVEKFRDLLNEEIKNEVWR